MNYLPQIIWLLTWPALIILTYYVTRYVIKKFEKNIRESDHQ